MTIHRNITDEEYNLLEGTRASVLKAFAKSSIAGYQCLTDDAPAGKDLRYGTALHAAVLEPERYQRVWATCKGLKPNAQANTFAKADADMAADDQLPLAEGWAEMIEASVIALKTHRVARVLLDRIAEREVSVVWEDDELGVTGKARIDAVADTKIGPILADLKTTSASDLAGFERDAFNYGYHVQQAWYSRGSMLSGLREGEPGFLFIAVTKTYPIDVAVLEPDDDFLRQGRVDCERAIARMRRYQAHGEMPGMDDGSSQPVPLSLPRWASDGIEPTKNWRDTA